MINGGNAVNICPLFVAHKEEIADLGDILRSIGGAVVHLLFHDIIIEIMHGVYRACVRMTVVIVHKNRRDKYLEFIFEQAELLAVVFK